MQTLKTIISFATLSNSATCRTSRNGRSYTAFGVSILDKTSQQTFHYNVVAFGKQGHFAKPLQKGTRITLVIQAQSQPDMKPSEMPANTRMQGSVGLYPVGTSMWLHRVMQESCDGRVRNESNCSTLNTRRSHRVGSHLKRKRKLNDVDARCLRYHRR